MIKNSSFIHNLLETFIESNVLTERGQVDSQINTTMAKLRYDMKNFDRNAPDAEEKAKKLWDRIQKPINTSASNHAGYTWNGASTKSTAFLKSPKNIEVVDGEVETYRDPLWFYIDPNTRKMASYLDEKGMIKPGHEDVIERVNKKYGLNLDPNSPIIKTGRNDTSNNGKQFDIWKNKYFIPWYKENSNDGASWIREYKQYVTGELPLDKPKEKPEEIKQEISVSAPVVTSEPEYDKSVIDSVVKLSLYSMGKSISTLKNIINGKTQEQFSNQQIYNTIKALKSKLSKEDIYYKDLDDMQNNYKQNNPDLKEEVKENKNSSWLSHNGDYSVFDKLNNLFRLKKESKEFEMNDSKRKYLKEENVYNSISTDENTFDPSKVTSDVFNDEETNALSEKDEVKKNKLTKEVITKINDTLKLNKEVQNILDEIRKINNTNDYNIWVVNEEGNTASLASKNAKIFKQNMNLCLSHDNDIEIFKSVQELHNWLREHRYPLPKNIKLHESAKENLNEHFIGLRNWLEDIKNEHSGLHEDFCCGNMGDTTSASLGTALSYLYKNKKNESLGKETFIQKLKSLKEDDMDVAGSFDSAVQADAGFGTDMSSDGMDNTSADLNSGMSLDQNNTNDYTPDGSEAGAPAGFGDLNINTGGYAPDEGNPDDSMATPASEDEYQIMDVLADSADNIRVKVKNLTSGEYEYKDLSEIDI